MIHLGDYNTLKVVKFAVRDNAHAYGGKETFGVYLDGGKEGDILMPQKYVPEGTKVGDELKCFVYLDQDERPIATTETPLAKVGDFAYLECTWVNEYGAFLDWGLMKDLFCPFREQKRKMEIGESYIVYIYIDEESYRIAATAKIDKYLQPFTNESISNKPSTGKNAHNGNSGKASPIPEGEGLGVSSESLEVSSLGSKHSLLIWQKTDLGFKVIVDNKYQGLIYRDQIFRHVQTGDRMDGYLEKIRPDGKLDISLQPTGRKQTKDFAATLLQWLKDHNGFAPYGDKSEPDDIKRTFQVSKKVFKKAIGDLYKQHLITITDNSITLANNK